MNTVRLLDITMLHLLWLTPLLIGIFVYGAWRRQKARALLLQADCPFSSVRSGRRIGKLVLFTTAAVAVVLALARPGWNEKETTVRRQGRDVVFMLDVSRSMLAQDLAPNRLERAKLAIRDCLEQLQGDRIGLVAFAGSAVVKCPLTLDYGFFRSVLDGINVDTVRKGGTMIGDGLRLVLADVFDKRQSKYRDVVLITDGEDHESFPAAAAEAAGKQGVRLIVVGLGDDREGRRIPVTDAAGNQVFLQYEGHEVWSRLDSTTLRQMAAATPGGRYLPVATGSIDLGEVYRDLIAGAAKREVDTTTVKQVEEKFQIPMALAFTMLCLELLISEWRRPGNAGN